MSTTEHRRALKTVRVHRGAVLAVSVSVLLTTVSVAIALHTPDPEARRELFRYVDVLLESSLPTWWSTSLLFAVAVVHAVVGITARAAGARGATAWFVSAGVVAGLSMTELSGLHERLDGAARQLYGPGPLTHTWYVLGALAAIPVAAVLLAVTARLDRPSARPFLVGGGLLLVSAVCGDVTASLLLPDAPRAAMLAAHAAELGENVGAVLLAVAALRAITLTGDGGTFRLRHRAPADGGESASGPVSWRSAWTLLVGICVAVSLLSLVFVLGAPVFEPGGRQWRLYVDVLVEANLPTWWSCSLLALAALAHLGAGAAARATRSPDGWCWFLSAVVLAALSLDDHTQLHERTERLGRALVAPGGTFPFYWLLPGAVAGLAVAAALALLAVRLRGQPRRFLVAGVGVLMFCALGLEVVQGLFMAASNENLGFALSYHLEELGENLATLLLLGSAASALTVRRAGRGFDVRYSGSTVTEPAQRAHPFY